MKHFILSCMIATVLFSPKNSDAQSSSWVDSIKNIVSPPEKTTVVLIDVTSSIGDDSRKIYQQSIAGMAKKMQFGDTLLLAPIGNISRGGFLPTYEGKVNSTGHPRDDEFNLDAQKKKFSIAAKKLIETSEKNSHSATYILDSIASASESLGDPKKDRTLILLTDGFEESKNWNFKNKEALTKTGIKKILADAKRLSLIPNLSGVKVYFSGLSGDAKQFAEMKEFWSQFFHETGATIEVIGRDAVKIE